MKGVVRLSARRVPPLLKRGTPYVLQIYRAVRCKVSGSEAEEAKLR